MATTPMTSHYPDEREQAAAPLGASDVLLAFGGTAAAGLCIGIKADLSTLTLMTILLPLAFAGTGLVTLPGFYVGTALMGAAPDVKSMGGIAMRAFRDLGTVLLGLVPALLFLSSVSTSVEESVVLGTIALTLASGIGLRAFLWYLRSEVEVHANVRLAYGAWACISVGLGWQFYLEVLRISGGLL